MNMRVKRCIGGSILLLLVFLSVGLVWHRTGTAKRRTTDTVDSRASVTDYRYRSRENTKNRWLKNLSYDFLDELMIPGMPSSKLQDLETQKIFSAAQCPQGICLTGEYVILTSYSEGRDDLGELFVFDRESGDFLVTLGMNPKSHLGGVAFDGQNVWICNSSSRSIERISYDFVKLMADQNTGEVVDASKMVDTIPVENTPSCITYDNGRLWIATHTVSGDSELVAYYYNSKKEDLTALSSYRIPRKVQGIAFDDAGRVYLSTSYGRAASSYLKVYASVFAMSGNPNKPQIQVEMPPGSEEIAISGDEIYVLFESAGEKYFYGTDGKGISLSPIDKILVLGRSALTG